MAVDLRATTYDIWATVHAERRALATDLSDLSSERWATPSGYVVDGGVTVAEDY